jgi:ABC-type polysaccharide/polyol phosphate export permease
VGLIQGIRWALVDVTRPTPFMMASSLVLTLVILIGSVAFFQYAEDTFADVV